MAKLKEVLSGGAISAWCTWTRPCLECSFSFTHPVASFTDDLENHPSLRLPYSRPSSSLLELCLGWGNCSVGFPVQPCFLIKPPRLLEWPISLSPTVYGMKIATLEPRGFWDSRPSSRLCCNCLLVWVKVNLPS